MSLINNWDKYAFECLFTENYASLLSVAKRMTADEVAARDIVQEVFARLWTNRKRYSDIKSPRDFLFIATRNRAIIYLRSKRIISTHRDRIIYEERFSAGVVEEETYIQLTDAIDSLPPRTGEVISLSLRGLRQKQIAEEMGISLPTVKSLKSDGIKKLRTKLGPLSPLLIYMLYNHHC